MANTESEVIRSNQLLAIELCLQSKSCKECRVHQFGNDKGGKKDRYFYSRSCGKQIIEYMKETFEKKSIDEMIGYAETIRLNKPREEVNNVR
jgi:hypothetical protein